MREREISYYFSHEKWGLQAGILFHTEIAVLVVELCVLFNPIY